MTAHSHHKEENLTKQPLVVHADDLGLSRAFNAGIRDAAKGEMLTSTSLRVNGTGFKEAVEEVLPELGGLGLGLHLNVVEGTTTRKEIPKASRLYHADGQFRLRFEGLLAASGSKSILKEIETDFRDQIEQASQFGQLDHLNAHQHCYAIPAIFEIACRLAQKYKIPYMRLPREKFYATGALLTHFRPWYGLNLLKHGVLNFFSRSNRAKAQAHQIRTNERFVGILYTGHMSTETILKGLKVLRKPQGVTEILVHPCVFDPKEEDQYINQEVQQYVHDAARQEELSALKSKSLLGALHADGWRLTCYRCLAEEENGHE